MRALIIEDQEEYATYLANGLTNNGFIVDTENNGRKALWKAKTVRYDVLIMDLHLPEKNGDEILNDLRKSKNHTPCIFISVEDELETKIKSLEMGADDYLSKPFSVQELIARAKAVLRRRGIDDTEVLKIGKLILDRLRYRVFYGDKEIRLRRKEYDLLQYFMQNPGRVISRSLLLEKIWDMNADPFTNTVDVHVQSLRKKIAAGSKGREVIRTVYGRGYELVISS